MDDLIELVACLAFAVVGLMLSAIVVAMTFGAWLLGLYQIAVWAIAGTWR